MTHHHDTDPITATRATAGQFGHPEDGGLVAADHSGDANKKVADLIERMERIVRNEYVHRDFLIHNCALGQITFGDVRDLCDAVRALPAEQDGTETETEAELRRALAQIKSLNAECDRRRAERDALKAEVEELRMALQAEIIFSDFVAAKFRINPDKLCFTVHVRPDGQEVATDRKPDGSEAASITWAEVHAGSRIALRAEQGEAK